MKQTIEIEVPEGKKAIWKDDKVVFEDIIPQLPKTWEEFCKIKNVNEFETYINDISEYIEEDNTEIRRYYEDRNYLPSKKAAEQHLALMQLHQLRDYYRQEWIPTLNRASFGIIRGVEGHLSIDRFMYSSKFLSFQTEEITKEFLTNFRDLIEQAGDLI